MEFRLINQTTLPPVEKLWDYCFEKKGTSFYDWYFTQYALKQNKIVGGFNGDDLATMVHLNPYVLNFRGEELKVKYLVGVATDPCARGQHAMGDLLNTTFNILRAAGNKLAILEPINAGIYQPYGFAYTHFMLEYNMPLSGLTIPHVDYEIVVQRVPTIEAKELIAPVYTKAMVSRTGFALRTSTNWQNMLTVAAGENAETIVVFEGGEAVGYALYLKDGETIQVQEMLSVHHRAKDRMLAYFKAFAGSFTTFKWLAPSDDLTYLSFKNQSYSPRIAPFMMSRIINVEKILKELQVPEKYIGKEFIIYIKDDFMTLNNAYAKVTFNAEGVDLKPTLEIPEITMDISTFTQLYAGTYSARHLYNQGKILCEDGEMINMFDEMLPKENNFINEYF